MHMFEKYTSVIADFNSVKAFIERRCKIKSKASYTHKWEDDAVQWNHGFTLEAYDDHITASFTRHTTGMGTSEYDVVLTAEELEMDDEEFETHISNEFASVIRRREMEARRIQRDNEETERKQLARLQEKYSDCSFAGASLASTMSRFGE